VAATPPSRRDRKVTRPNTGVENRVVQEMVKDPTLSGSRRRVRSVMENLGCTEGGGRGAGGKR
jgi:hypothetical protein